MGAPFAHRLCQGLARVGSFAPRVRARAGAVASVTAWTGRAAGTGSVWPRRLLSSGGGKVSLRVKCVLVPKPAQTFDAGTRYACRTARCSGNSFSSRDL